MSACDTESLVDARPEGPRAAMSRRPDRRVGSAASSDDGHLEVLPDRPEATSSSDARRRRSWSSDQEDSLRGMPSGRAATAARQHAPRSRRAARPRARVRDARVHVVVRGHLARRLPPHPAPRPASRFRSDSRPTSPSRMTPGLRHSVATSLSWRRGSPVSSVSPRRARPARLGGGFIGRVAQDVAVGQGHDDLRSW